MNSIGSVALKGAPCFFNSLRVRKFLHILHILHIAKCTVHISGVVCLLSHLDSTSVQPNSSGLHFNALHCHKQKFCTQERKLAQTKIVHKKKKTSTRYCKVKFHWFSSLEMLLGLTSHLLVHKICLNIVCYPPAKIHIFHKLHKIQNVNIFGLLPKALTK